MAENTLPGRGRGPSLKEQRSEASDDSRTSTQTQEIVDRLKKDGELLRNKGKNSIRSVNIELSKFSDAFNAISGSIQNQSGILAGMQATAEDQAEIAQKKSDFDELSEGKESDTAREIRLLREKAELFNAKADLNDAKKRDGGGLGDILGKLASGGFLKTLGLLAGGGFIAYNLAKGFINKMTDGGFDTFVKSVQDFDWTGLGTTIVEFMGSAKDGLANMITFFDDPLKILAGLTGAAVGAKLLTSIGTSIAAKAIGQLVMGSPGAMSGAGGKGMGKAMMGALGAAGLIYAQDIADFIVGEAKNSDVTKIDIKNAATTVGISVASGATIGAMFGPKGMLAGAILGGAYGLGLGLVDYVKENLLDMGKTSKEGKQAIQKLRARKEMVEAMGQEKFDAWAAGNEDMNEELLLQQAFEAQEDIRAKIEEAKKKKANVKTTDLVSINRYTGERTYRARNQDSILRDLERADEEIQRYQDQLMTLDSALQTTGYDPTALIPKVEAIPFDQSGPEMAPGKIVETEEEMSPELKAYLDRNDISKPIAGPSPIAMAPIMAPISINYVSGAPVNNVLNQNVQGGSSVASMTSMSLGGGSGGQDVFGAVS